MADPYRNYKYDVEISGFLRAGFSKVTGLKHTVEVIEYREGGENETPRKLPGQSTFDNVTLERGMSTDSDFINWIEEVFNLDSSQGEQGGEDFRRTVVIYLKNKAGTRVKKWTVYRAWPTEKGNPDLDATANDVAIESLVLANEGVNEETLAA
jgi:phage tail-like protein